MCRLRRAADEKGRTLSATPERAAKVKLQAYVWPELSERARNAWWHTRNEPSGFETLSDLVEAAVREMTERLEREHNGGKEFPVRPERSGRGGRPPGR